MTNARNLIDALADAGVDCLFANPGTSEMQIVEALGHDDRIRSVLCLFEGVASGAADGYARMAGKPAATLLHLGPGFANAAANLHNARRAGSPIVNIVGDHALTHRKYDAPLATDLPNVVSEFTVAQADVTDPACLYRDARAAVESARRLRGPTTLIIPADIAWTAHADQLDMQPSSAAKELDEKEISEIADALRSDGDSSLLLLGGTISEASIRSAYAIAAAVGCDVARETFCARVARGEGLPELARIPYFAEQAVEFLKPYSTIVLVGANEPISFFAYPEKPSKLTDSGTRFATLAAKPSAIEAALIQLQGQLEARGYEFEHVSPVPTLSPDPAQELDLSGVADAIARHLPENAVIVDEAITASGAIAEATVTAPRHDVLELTGGSIGAGLPLATGAALAAPSRKVICLEGDGSALYTIQALWTQVREKLDVVTVIFANRSYRILEIEMLRTGSNAIPPGAARLFDLGDPSIDFVSIARGFGMPASTADTAGAFDIALARAIAEPGPCLIEAIC